MHLFYLDVVYIVLVWMHINIELRWHVGRVANNYASFTGLPQTQ